MYPPVPITTSGLNSSIIFFTSFLMIEKRINKEYQIIWATGPKQYDIIKERFAKQDITYVPTCSYNNIWIKFINNFFYIFFTM